RGGRNHRRNQLCGLRDLHSSGNGTSQIILNDDIVGSWQQIVKDLPIGVIGIVPFKELAQVIRNGVAYPACSTTGFYDDLSVGISCTDHRYRFQIIQDQRWFGFNDNGIGYGLAATTLGIYIVSACIQIPKYAGTLGWTHCIGRRRSWWRVGVQQGIN